jgi:hypothetical protein
VYLEDLEANFTIFKNMTTKNIHLGSSVRLTGLKSAKFNNHVGRVVQFQPDGERLGIMLHDVVWKPDRLLSSKTMMIKPENVRLCPEPEQRPLQTTQMGTPSIPVLRRLLGERGWSLPEGVVDLVIEKLVVQRVVHDDVRVCGSSSTRGDFPLDCVLSSTKDEWWISQNGSFPYGEGEEYLEFSFGGIPRLVSFVGISIPPMPGGPLSVRRFHMEALIGSSGANPEGNEVANWIDVSPDLITLDRDGLQEFALVPQVETTKMRLVCTQNACSAMGLHDDDGDPVAVPVSVWCVGLFKVRFA